MPTPESYEGLAIEQLRERLALAEAACVLFGWGTATPSSSDAQMQAWMEWADHVGLDYCSPQAHPDLNERRIHELVTTRRETRERTLAAIEEEWVRDVS